MAHCSSRNVSVLPTRHSCLAPWQSCWPTVYPWSGKDLLVGIKCHENCSSYLPVSSRRRRRLANQQCVEAYKRRGKLSSLSYGSVIFNWLDISFILRIPHDDKMATYILAKAYVESARLCRWANDRKMVYSSGTGFMVKFH